MARIKLKVDTTACIGCGTCVGVYPDDFVFNADGLAEVVSGEAEEEAKDVCPVGAIVED